MVRNKLAAVVAAFAALQADVAGALGLGDFTLNSALNQPLDAEIRLLNTVDLNDAQVIIKLASIEDFDNAGVIRDFFLTNLRFAVELDGKGGGLIRVTSREPVIEPYLDLMVEARWPSGRLLREYTVLLDLPVFSDSAVASVGAAPSAKAIVPSVTVEAKPAAMPVSPVMTAASVPVLSENRKTLTEGKLQPGEQYRVKQDETLWEIALKAKPSRKVSVQQTMVGIQRNNPQAFINNNINRLKAGSVLRLPTEQEVRAAVGRGEATSEVAQQNRVWKSKEPQEDAAPVPLQAASSKPETPAEVVEEPRLVIAAADEGSSAGVGDAGVEEGEVVESKAKLSALQNELSQSQESLDKVQLENQDMNARLANMESKLATMQRLLEVKDEKLATLQASVGKAAEQPGAGKSAPGAKKVDAKPDTAQDDLLSLLLANPMYLGAGAGVLLLLLILAVRRRGAGQTEQAEELEQMAEPSEELVAVSVDDEPVAMMAEAELNEVEAVAELIDEDQPGMSHEETVEESLGTVEEEPVTSETGDAVAEADIYIAYGRYQQAMDLLAEEIQQSPSSELYLKLLEVCVEARDKQTFLSVYQDLQATGDESAVAEAKALLSASNELASWLDTDSAEEEEFAIESFDSGDDGMADGQLAELDISLDEELDDALQADLGQELDETFDAELELDGDIETHEAVLEGGDLDSAEATDELDLELDLGELNDELNELSSEPIAQDDEIEELDASLEAGLDNEFAAFEDLETEQSDELADLELDEELDEELDAALGAGLDSEFADLRESADELESLNVELDNELPNLQDQELADTAELDKDLLELAEEADLSELEELAGADESELDLDAELDLELGDDFDSLAESADLEDLAAEFGQSLEAERVDDQLKLGGDVVDDAAPVAATADASATDDDFDFLAGEDEVVTKLDLARAYIDMGDVDGAKDILDEVLESGDEQQRQDANELLDRI